MTPSMEPDSVVPVDLSGRWLLDRQASDDVRAKIMPVFDRKERRIRQEERTYDVPPPVAGPSSDDHPSEPSTVEWIQRRREREAQSFVALLSPANQLDIQHEGGQVRVQTDKGEGSKTLTPGQSSALFTGFGAFEMSSGWKDETFIIDLSGAGDNKLHTVERYTLRDEGQTLEVQLDARVPNFGKHSFRFLYRKR